MPPQAPRLVLAVFSLGERIPARVIHAGNLRVRPPGSAGGQLWAGTVTSESKTLADSRAVVDFDSEWSLPAADGV